MEKAKTKAPKATPKPKAPAGRVSPVSHGVGRRKSSVARVWLRAGKGKFTVNGKDYKNYFETDVTRMDAATPFRVAPVSAQFDVDVNVFGGGLSSQAGAIKLGIARALVRLDEASRPLLRKNNLLTVDARRKERKKYGQRGARRRFQFVKR